MNEGKRLAYLQAMGVESYFPRFQLPGAKPSVLCDSLPEIPAANEPIAAPAPNQNRGLESLRTVLRPPVSVAAVTPSLQAAPAVAEEPARDIRFCLRFFLVSGGLLLVDSSSTAAPEKPLGRLAANILVALGYRPTAIKQHIFHWPLAQSGAVANTEQAALEAATAAVLGSCEREQLLGVLRMGEAAQRFCQAGEIVQLDCPSLIHLLQFPAEKRQLWALLKARPEIFARAEETR